MMQENTTPRKLEELLYKKIITADGKKIGHVFDIQISRDGAFRINKKPRTIPWEGVERIDQEAIHLKPGYEPGKDK